MILFFFFSGHNAAVMIQPWSKVNKMYLLKIITLSNVICTEVVH